MTLHHGEIVKLDLVRDGSVPRGRFKEFKGIHSADFKFDKYSRLLKIQARYSPCLAQSNDVTNTLH